MSSKIHRFDTREEWLQARTSLGIGASDSPAILGVSPYKSAFQLYQERLGLEPITQGEAEALEWGQILERPIAQRYTNETQRTVQFDGSPFVIRQSDECKFMVATIDARIIADSPLGPGPGTLEIKNVSSYVGQRWTEPQEPPVEFLVQLQHQLYVTGDQWGSIAALIGGVMFVWADLPRDDEFIALLLREVEAFQRRVVDRRPPDIDASDHTKGVLRRLYPRDEPITIELPANLIAPLDKYLRLKADVKHAADGLQWFENTIRAALGPATLGILPDGRSFSLRTRKGYEVKAHSVGPTRILKFHDTKVPRRVAGRPAPLELIAGEEEGDDHASEA